jgi:hypothetical protein
MCAGDLGSAPRFLSVFVVLSFFRFAGESTLPPQAPNAHRWAVELDGLLWSRHIEDYEAEMSPVAIRR